jgi:hypothetical protein
MKQYTIKSEADAFDLLEKALQNQLGDKLISIKFDSWPVLQVRLEGPGYDSTISSDTSVLTEPNFEVRSRQLP